MLNASSSPIQYVVNPAMLSTAELDEVIEREMAKNQPDEPWVEMLRAERRSRGNATAELAQDSEFDVRELHWTEGDNRERINHLMSKAFSAFDRLYFHSQTNGDLLTNSRVVSKALSDIRYLARTNDQS